MATIFATRKKPPTAHAIEGVHGGAPQHLVRLHPFGRVQLPEAPRWDGAKSGAGTWAYSPCRSACGERCVPARSQDLQVREPTNQTHLTRGVKRPGSVAFSASHYGYVLCDATSPEAT